MSADRANAGASACTNSKGAKALMRISRSAVAASMDPNGVRAELAALNTRASVAPLPCA
jgi:hypothetical protein